MICNCLLGRGIGVLLLCAGFFGPVAAQEQDPANQAVPEPELLVPEGTTIPIVLSTFLNSRSTQVGDSFYADTTYPIWIQQRLVVPRGSIIKGTVTHVQRPGRIKGKGQVAIRFDNILLPNGVTRDLTAELQGIHGPGAEKIDRQTETIEMDGSKGRDAGDIASGGGQGAIIGAIAGGGKGAAIGGGVGGAVGLATVLFSRGRELVLEPGTQFDIVLKKTLRFAYGETDFTNQELNSAGYVTRTRPRYNRDQDRDGAQSGRRGFPSPLGFPWP